jgi:iron complex outermembrane recepter protein
MVNLNFRQESIMTVKTQLALAIAFINTSLALPALAQDNQTTKVVRDKYEFIEEIVVTATKQETTLMSTPIAITVLNQDTLERAQITNAKDLAKLVPNMQVNFDAAESAPIISMRGVRSTNTTELGDPAVGLHIDSIYSPRPQGAMALLFDVERVEAQRGPQGTLFGRNSTVGNINIISKKPVIDEFDAALGTQLGSFNEQLLRGMVNIPVSDIFALRASFITETRDSYLEGYYDANQWDTRYLSNDAKSAPLFIGTETEKNLVQRNRTWNGGSAAAVAKVKADPSDFYNNADQYAVRLSGLLEPTDTISWQLTLEQFSDTSAGTIETIDCTKAAQQTNPDGTINSQLNCTGIYGAGADEYTLNVNIPGAQDLTISSLRSSFRWDINYDVALVYNAGIAKQTITKAIDIDRGTTHYDAAQFLRDASFKSQSHELQLQSIDNTHLQWVTGVFFFNENNDMQKIYSNSWDVTNYFQQPDRTLSSIAGFAQGSYTLTDDTKLTLGYRHTEDTKEDVGGHNKTCNSSNANALTPALNNGQCHPYQNWESFNQLPKNYFWNPAIYTLTTNNDIKYEEGYDNYRIGVDHSLNSNTMIYSYIANGTKSGGIGDVVVQKLQDPKTAAYLTDAAGKPLEVLWKNTYNKEEVITLEIGLKTDLFDNSLRVNSAVFYSDYSDLQVAAPASLFTSYRKNGNTVVAESNVAYQTNNIGKAEIAGLEIEFEWALSAKDRLTGYATWLHTEIIGDFVQPWGYAEQQLFADLIAANPEQQAPEVNLKGNQLPAAPEFEFNINYSHTFQLSSKANLVPWIAGSWRADSYYSIFNVDKYDFSESAIAAYNDKRPATTNVDLGIKLISPGKSWSLEAFVNNATNEVDFSSGNSTNGVISGVVSMPRFYGIRANYNY